MRKAQADPQLDLLDRIPPWDCICFEPLISCDGEGYEYCMSDGCTGSGRVECEGCQYCMSVLPKR